MKYLNLLGLKVRDKVTNFEGIVTSVSYDLYGCIQTVVTPQIKDEQKESESKSRWFDAQRLKIIDNNPVMSFRILAMTTETTKGQHSSRQGKRNNKKG